MIAIEFGFSVRRPRPVLLDPADMEKIQFLFDGVQDEF